MRDVVERVLELIRDHYVLPDVGERMIARVGGLDYSGAGSPAELASRLTADLRAVSHDQHLSIVHHDEPQPDRPARRWGPDDAAAMRAIAATRNFGFERVERLAGNVGYIDLRAVMPPEVAGESAAAAMRLVAETHALVLDLRRNGGGHPAMVALLCSYLMGPDPVLLNVFESRDDDLVRQSWTVPFVPGPRYLQRPVYVLIGPITMSGGEELAYNLKHHRRALTVGERTSGAAHLTQAYRVDAHFTAMVPFGRPVHPVTGTSWEGTGVVPDIDAPADDALVVAHDAALEDVLKSLDESPASRALRAETEAARRS